MRVRLSESVTLGQDAQVLIAVTKILHKKI